MTDENYGSRIFGSLLVLTNLGGGTSPGAYVQQFNKTVFTGVVTGNGGGLTDLNATNLVGTLPDARLSGNVVTNNFNFSGAGIYAGFGRNGTRGVMDLYYDGTDNWLRSGFSTKLYLSPSSSTSSTGTSNIWAQSDGKFYASMLIAATGFTSTVSNAAPVTSISVATSATTFWTNTTGFSVMVGYNATTLTGLGLSGTTFSFTSWPMLLTGGSVPVRNGHIVSFTNGASAVTAAWTPFP
jgi:hypothetical protein